MHTRRQPLPRIAGAAAVALCSVPGAALAEHPQDAFWGELSYFYPEISSTASSPSHRLCKRRPSGLSGPQPQQWLPGICSWNDGVGFIPET